MTNISKQLGVRIRIFRKQAELTQQELAEKAGVSYKYLGQIERGQVNLSVEKMVDIANGLHIEPCKLLETQDKESSILVEAQLVLSGLTKKELCIALDILKSLKRHSSL